MGTPHVETWDDEVTVGVDGSQPGLHAARWAVAEAVRRGVPLTVLHAYAVPVGLASTTSTGGPDPLRREAEDVLESLRAEVELPGGVQGAHPVPVRYAAVRGAAATVLVDRSRTCPLVVVGRHGPGRIDRGLLGSVSSAVAALGRGTVAVVPSDADVDRVARVVVGLDEPRRRVLDVAFSAAERADAPVRVLHVVHPDLALGVNAPDAGWQLDSLAEIKAQITEEVARWADKCPTVRWTAEVATGVPAKVLAADLRSDDLLVVGGRRHGAVRGRLLGSVADTLLRHAPCTVLVAHSG